MYKYDGHLAKITKSTDITRGMVLRVVDEEEGVTHAFGDHLVLNTYWRDKQGVRRDDLISGGDGAEWYILLARPYAFVTSADTACPSILQGFEQYEVGYERLCAPDSRYRVVINSRGLPARHTT